MPTRSTMVEDWLADFEKRRAEVGVAAWLRCRDGHGPPPLRPDRPQRRADVGGFYTQRPKG